MKFLREWVPHFYFDRTMKGIEGRFTFHLVHQETREMVLSIEKLDAVSGQAGYERTSWVRGKSPIPFSGELGEGEELKIALRNPLQERQWAGDSGIGEFYAVYTEKDKATIKGANGEIRTHVGVHPENDFPGTAGCIGLVAETEEQRRKILLLKEMVARAAEHHSEARLVVL